MKSVKPEHILRAEAFLNRTREISKQLTIDQKRLQQLQARRNLLFDSGCPNDLLLSVRAAENDIHRDINRLLKAEQDVLTVIDHVEDPRYKQLLRCFFVNGMTTFEVAEAMNYDERTVWRLRAPALEVVAQILCNNLCDIDLA